MVSEEMERMFEENQQLLSERDQALERIRKLEVLL
jgi:hypothetical protein